MFKFSYNGVIKALCAKKKEVCRSIGMTCSLCRRNTKEKKGEKNEKGHQTARNHNFEKEKMHSSHVQRNLEQNKGS